MLTAEIVVADLTGLNPNVFYEIGIRHMAQKPIIHMHEVGQIIPFDVSLYRSIAFSRARPKDLILAQRSLREAIDAVLAEGYEVENPVTNVQGRFQIEQHTTPAQKVLIEQIRGMEMPMLTSKADSEVAPQTRFKYMKPTKLQAG